MAPSTTGPAGRRAPAKRAPGPGEPLLGSIDLSPDPASPGTEQFQSEISTSVILGGRQFLISSGGGGTLQVSDATDPAAIGLLERVALTGYRSQSVASHGDLLAVALSPTDYATTGGRGVVRFYRVGTDGSLSFLKDVDVGYLPDSIAFNGSGRKLVIANEGEPADGYVIDRPGSIGIIAIKGKPGRNRFSYTDLDFSGLTIPAGLRISGPAGTTAATDIEPEYVSILGRYAYVTLQENNGVAKVNRATRTIEKIFALGTVDYRNLLVDLSDRDGPLDAQGRPTSTFAPKLGQAHEGLRMPDAIAAFRMKGRDYFVTANEGDGRDGAEQWGTYSDETRGSGSNPDTTASRVKRLADDATVGSPDRITTFGGRSISLFDGTTGALLWDSGNSLQTIAVAAGMYDDGRSDDKGVEPEGVVVAKLKGRTYAIVGMERTGRSMLAVFDLSDPRAGRFVTSTVIPGSISPEGLHIVDAKQSPAGRTQLIVSNEVSNTVNVFDLEALIAAPPVAGAGTFQGTMLKDAAAGPDLSITSLLTNGEFTGGLAPGSPVYAPTGIFDGMGAYDNGDGTYTLLVNSELGNAVGAGYLVNDVVLTGARVHRFIVDKDVDDDASNGFQSAILQGGLAYQRIYNPDGTVLDDVSDLVENRSGFDRFCSAALFEAGQFGPGRGLVDRIYFAGEETGGNSSLSSGNQWALDVATGDFWAVPAMGRGAWENLTEVDTGNDTHVAFVLMDDTSPFDADGDGELEAAPMFLYVGRKDSASSNFLERNGLADGKLYVWVADDASITDFTTFNGSTNNVPQAGAWVEIDSSRQPSLASADGSSGHDAYGYPTQRTLWSRAEAAAAFGFSRPEDVATNPADGSRIVLASTGTSALGGADTFGTLYTAQLDFSDIDAPRATLSILYDGDRVVDELDPDRAALGTTIIRSPDNLTWSEDGHVYVQEDRSISSAYFAQVEASIWKLNPTDLDPVTGQAASERWAVIDRAAVPAAYGQSDPRGPGGTSPDPGNWESSGIIDVSTIYDAAPGTWFLADVQAHSLRDGNLWGNGYLVEGGQINLIHQPQPAGI